MTNPDQHGQILGWVVVEDTHAGPWVVGAPHDTPEAAARDCQKANEAAQSAGVPIDYTVAVLIEEQTGGGNG